MAVDRDELVATIPPLRAFARSLALDAALADDLVQDTLMLALRAEAQFTPGTSLRGWLFTILRNRFVSLVSRGPRLVSISGDEQAAACIERPEIPAPQESGIEIAAFKRAFARLPEPYREVLVLVGVHGLPYEEIARICGCEVGTVKSRVCRGRERLRQLLTAGEEAPKRAPSKDRTFSYKRSRPVDNNSGTSLSSLP